MARSLSSEKLNVEELLSCNCWSLGVIQREEDGADITLYTFNVLYEELMVNSLKAIINSKLQQPLQGIGSHF